MKVLQWLDRNKNVVKLSGIAKETGIHNTQLSLMIKGERPANEKHINKLTSICEKYGYSEKSIDS